MSERINQAKVSLTLTLTIDIPEGTHVATAAKEYLRRNPDLIEQMKAEVLSVTEYPDASQHHARLGVSTLKVGEPIEFLLNYGERRGGRFVRSTSTHLVVNEGKTSHDFYRLADIDTIRVLA